MPESADLYFEYMELFQNQERFEHEGEWVMVCDVSVMSGVAKFYLTNERIIEVPLYGKGEIYV